MLNFKAVGIESCWGSAAGWQWQVTDEEEDEWYSIQQIYLVFSQQHRTLSYFRLCKDAITGRVIFMEPGGKG
jgi:hypothetical protein